LPRRVAADRRGAARLSRQRSALEDAARAAARRFGTPLYLYDVARLRADAVAVRDAFPDPWIRLYSLKANGLPAVVTEIVDSGDFSASAVSGGEVDLAMRSGLPPARIVLEGIGKTDFDLALAAELAVRRTPLAWVSLESVEDAAALAEAVSLTQATRNATRLAKVDVLVRVNPRVVPETHAGLAVGSAESKFGVLPEELGAVIAAGGGARGALRWRGIHLHVGSQLNAIDAWRGGARLGLRLLQLQRASLPNFDTIDFGGGFPVAYDAGAESVPSPAHFANAVRAELDELPTDARPARMAVEPGRAVVCGSGWLIARVLHVRNRERPIVVLDAGMTELIRPALYGVLHPMRALTSLGRPIGGDDGTDAVSDTDPHALVRVDGAVCESTDSFGSVSLPPLERGDIVAIGMVGAYGSSMFSTYNGRARPPEIAWNGSDLRQWRRRGSAKSLP
jgi:diaminopimelate decarboxylase